jgi:D-cysteine desulfhydrase family pyridoxal phosphate-dependent enzyme
VEAGEIMNPLEDLKARLVDFPKTPLIQSPTPLQQIGRPQEAPGVVDLLIKRDDLTGLALGGNKGRKLEYIVADALAQGADTIVTWGGIQSNWCLQTAAAAARVGIRTAIVLLRKPGASAEGDGNVLLDHLCGATVRVVDVEAERGMLWVDDVADLVEPVMEEEREAGRKPYLAPIGGSAVDGSMEKPFGAMGYAEALVELIEQAEARDLSFDTVVLGSGSAGTQAGLVAAAKAVVPKLRIVGISIVSEADTLRGRVGTIAAQLLESLAIDAVIEDDDVVAIDDYLEPGYAVLTPAISRAIAALARSEGVVLDPVYTGKAWLGMLDLMQKGFITDDEKVVFIHTGGTAALFPYREQVLDYLRL